MPVGSGSVIDYVNTTSGVAIEVIAKNGISGNGVVNRFTSTPPAFSFIVTQGSDNITTEAGDDLITQT
jgi:ABC-type uncharacterized transport system permease subunit